MSKRVQLALAAVGAALAFGSASAFAQSADLSIRDTIIVTNGAPIGDRDAYGLPGVGMGAGGPTTTATGPGGLRNGIGAIGSGPPSTSSYNPVLVEPPSGEGLLVPLRF